MLGRAPVHWDIFCKVIDNYGDIGVCWRLARQLGHEYGCAARLWVNDLNSFQRLVPEIETTRTVQHCRGIQIRHWDEAFPVIATDEMADVVIEALGCTLSDAYLAAMVQSTQGGKPAPVWINLEYLSAEPWIESHHGLSSPHPHLPLTKHFFFPGFTLQTGGLVGEAGLDQRRQAFQADSTAQAVFWKKLGLRLPGKDEVRVSMFAYTRPETEALFTQLLELWSAGTRPYTLLIPEGIFHSVLTRFFATEASTGKVLQKGALKVHVFPFLDQDDYDHLLWACDLNFVRGEDSFVRAQWAGRPFIWQIYPQQEEAHVRKLEAFLDRYVHDWLAGEAGNLRAVWGGWNQTGPDHDLMSNWQVFEQNLSSLNRHAEQWIRRIANGGDLVSRLIRFVETQSAIKK